MNSTQAGGTAHIRVGLLTRLQNWTYLSQYVY